MTEQWRTAVYDGEIYEGLYKVSNLGRILSLNYDGTGKSKLMNPRERKDGYSEVKLWKNGEKKYCSVHRLVAFTFLPNPEGKPCINHKIEGEKGKKINMVIFNEDGTIDEERTTIEWVTYKENSNYGTCIERSAKAKKGKHHSEETKKKISEAMKGKPAHNKGKPMSEEQKKKLSEINKGKHLSEEHRSKISRAHKGEKHPMFGKHHSEESKKKISESIKKRKLQKQLQPDGCLPLW